MIVSSKRDPFLLMGSNIFDEHWKNKYFAAKHKTYLIKLYIAEMNYIMDVNENERFKIKKEVYLISMVAIHNSIETLTHISH
jgi:hypothetical protein